MILAVDVAYFENVAIAGGVFFESWDSEKILYESVCRVDGVASYIPGNFFLRELPCIKKLLEKNSIKIDCIVIDGYVTLGVDQLPGLGMKLWEDIGGKIPIIGVAKTGFFGTPENTKIYRGNSSKPLFITTVGIKLDDAKYNILKMKGKFRIPDFLKAVDHLSRKAISQGGINSI
ncbi:endonuclease V [Collimonas sp. NPDC087041]|uniref:endonuclease V n=1 Tax=Collimonas sp. NPDC087041 TaxID=3363960 RepID=UPI003816C668